MVEPVEPDWGHPRVGNNAIIDARIIGQTGRCAAIVAAAGGMRIMRSHAPGAFGRLCSCTETCLEPTRTPFPASANTIAAAAVFTLAVIRAGSGQQPAPLAGAVGNLYGLSVRQLRPNRAGHRLARHAASLVAIPARRRPVGHGHHVGRHVGQHAVWFDFRKPWPPLRAGAVLVLAGRWHGRCLFHPQLADVDGSALCDRAGHWRRMGSLRRADCRALGAAAARARRVVCAQQLCCRFHRVSLAGALAAARSLAMAVCGRGGIDRGRARGACPAACQSAAASRPARRKQHKPQQQHKQRQRRNRCPWQRRHLRPRNGWAWATSFAAGWRVSPCPPC